MFISLLNYSRPLVDVYMGYLDRYKDKEKRKAYNREYLRAYMRKWRKTHPRYDVNPTKRAYRRKHYASTRRKVLEYLGGAKCVKCGCTNELMLEINHKKLGGRKELKERDDNVLALYRSILREKRKREFDVRCKVCNAAHYCEIKFRGRFEIKWYPSRATASTSASSNAPAQQASLCELAEQQPHISAAIRNA